MGKLRLRHHLDGIIPFSGCLKTQLAGVSDQVVGCLERMHRVSLGSLVTQSHFQLVLPLHLLLVVVIRHHRYTSQQRVVALTTLVPVVRYIVLQELQIVISAESPEVRFEDHDIRWRSFRFEDLRCHLFYNVALRLLGLCIRHDWSAHLFQMSLRSLHQVWTVEIDIHQGLIEHHTKRIAFPSIRTETQEMIGRRAIIREWSEEHGISGIIRRHLSRVDTLPDVSQRVHITFHYRWSFHHHIMPAGTLGICRHSTRKQS